MSASDEPEGGAPSEASDDDTRAILERRKALLSLALLGLAATDCALPEAEAQSQRRRRDGGAPDARRQPVPMACLSYRPPEQGVPMACLSLAEKNRDEE